MTTGEQKFLVEPGFGVFAVIQPNFEEDSDREVLEFLGHYKADAEADAMQHAKEVIPQHCRAVIVLPATQVRRDMRHA